VTVSIRPDHLAERAVAPAGQAQAVVRGQRREQQVYIQRRLLEGVWVRVAAAQHLHDIIDRVWLVGVIDERQAEPHSPGADREGRQRDRRYGQPFPVPLAGTGRAAHSRDAASPLLLHSYAI
jgi:hypothetical protein